MYDELNEELSEVKEQLNSLRRKQVRLKSCRELLSQAREQGEKLTSELSRHEHVMKQLHGLSFTHLLALIRGIQDEEDQKLHQLVANLNAGLMTAKANISRLEDEERYLVDQLKALQNTEAEYNHLLVDKEQQILSQSNTELAKQLLAYAHQSGDIKTQVKETREALDAAHQAANALGDCLASLEKARNWGVWDMMGGGTLTTMMKRSHMDDAQSMMDNASYYVKRLARELQDVHGIGNSSVEVNPGGFLHFADYFFDDLFVDWAVQNQINKAFDGVTLQHNQVQQLQHDLQRQLESLNRDKIALEEKRRRLLEEG